MPIILNRWENLINNTLHPLNANLVSLTEAGIQNLIYESEAEQERVRALLIEGVIDRAKIRDKQQYVQVNQALLIRLLDKLYAYKQTEGLNDYILSLFDTISRHLETTLAFIEDFFSNYFDRNEKVPAAYLKVSIEELYSQLVLLQKNLESSTTIDPALASILVHNFKKFCLHKATSATYNELLYQKDLMNELLADGTLASEASIREVLFYFNFNEDEYIAYEFKKLRMLTDALSTRREKVAALRFEQKTLNQMRMKLNSIFFSSMPSLKEQMNQWIEEEIKFLEMEQVPEASAKTDLETEDKIHTSLSVAKLALLIRLMVIDKMITNRVIAQVLRIIAKTVTTLQKENIAYGSLETKYHNPDRGTITAVKDMLFQWINIINKL